MSKWTRYRILIFMIVVGMLFLVAKTASLVSRLNLNSNLIECGQSTHGQFSPCSLAISSNDMRASYHLGRSAFLAGSLDQAITLLSGHWVSDPNDKPAGLYLGMAYRQRGDEALALDVWRNIDAGSFFYLRGKMLSSSSDLQTSIVLGERNPIEFYTLGDAYSSAGRLADARSAFEQGLALDAENSFTAWFTRGKLHELSNEWSNAVEAYIRAEELLPTNFEVYVPLGEIYRRHLNNSDAALVQYATCADKTHHMWCYLLASEVEREVEHNTEALEWIQQAIQRFPANPFPHLALGQMWEILGDLDQARTAYLGAAQLDASLYWSYYYLGGLAMKKGDWQEAITQFLHVVELNPDNADMWLLLGNAYQQAGRKKDAITAFERVLLLMPDNAKAKAASIELGR